MKDGYTHVGIEKRERGWNRAGRWEVGRLIPAPGG